MIRGVQRPPMVSIIRYRAGFAPIQSGHGSSCRQRSVQGFGTPWVPYIARVSSFARCALVLLVTDEGANIVPSGPRNLPSLEARARRRGWDPIQVEGVGRYNLPHACLTFSLPHLFAFADAFSGTTDDLRL